MKQLELFNASTQHNDIMYHIWYEQQADLAYEDGEEFECDTVKVRQAFAEKYVNWLNEVLGTNIKYESLYMPSEYNFKTDMINVTWSDADYQLAKLWVANGYQTKLMELVKQHTTSRSGYMALRTESQVWSDKELLMGIILDLVTEIEYEGCNDFDTWYDRNCVYDNLTATL